LRVAVGIRPRKGLRDEMDQLSLGCRSEAKFEDLGTAIELTDVFNEADQMENAPTGPERGA